MNRSAGEILREYARCFFGSSVAESSAGGILALEKNWEGPLAENGGVDATSIAAWRSLNEELAAYGQPPDPLGGLVFHPRFSVGSEPGWPDLVFIRRRDRRLMFRELKTDKGRVTDRQAAVLELLAACGLDAGVWRPADMERIGRELL